MNTRSRRRDIDRLERAQRPRVTQASLRDLLREAWPDGVIGMIVDWTGAYSPPPFDGQIHHIDS